MNYLSNVPLSVLFMSLLEDMDVLENGNWALNQNAIDEHRKLVLEAWNRADYLLDALEMLEEEASEYMIGPDDEIPFTIERARLRIKEAAEAPAPSLSGKEPLPTH